ncbi:hypothetical protein [Enterobacter phage 02_vB_Eclo_IJM]|nr:hypothetical protein [Enterobacter phage 02_vB_Eclo_IJM]
MTSEWSSNDERILTGPRGPCPARRPSSPTTCATMRHWWLRLRVVDI